MTKKVWVLCCDYGLDGLSEPFIAFATEAGAIGAKEITEKFGVGKARIVETPLYELTAADD